MKIAKFKLAGVSFLVTSVIFLVTALGHAEASETIPEQDPSREWRAIEYADTLFLTLKTKYPELELRIDEKALPSYESSDWTPRSGFKAAREEGLRNRAREIDLFRFASNALPPQLSILLEQLQAGERIDLKMGEATDEREIQLRNWLLNQKDGTVEPHIFMTEATRLANGNLIEGWAIAWNVIRHGWPAAMTRNYGEISQKFVSMTGERHLWQGAAQYVVLPQSKWRKVETITIDPNSRENNKYTDPIDTKLNRMKLVIVKRGDEFSYLYHRIGIEFFTMLSSKYLKKDSWAKLLGKISALGEFFLFTKTAGLAGERNKRLLNDLASVDSAVRLLKLVSGKALPKESGLKGAKAYLQPNEREYGKRYQLPSDGRPAAYFGAKVDPKFWAPKMSVEEMKLRFYHAANIDKFALDPILLASSGDLDRMQNGLRDYEKSRQADEELNSLMRQWLKGPHSTMIDGELTPDLSYSMVENLEHIKSTAPELDFKEIEIRLNSQIERVLASFSKVPAFTNRQWQRRDVHSCSAIFR